MWISDLECSSLFKVVSNYITVVDIYFQDCLPSTPWYSADSRHHDHSKRINVASRINDMKAMEESKEYKPCNQDKQGRKGSTNKFCQITGRIVTTTVTATAADQWLQFGLFLLVAENAQLASQDLIMNSAIYSFLPLYDAVVTGAILRRFHK